MLPVNLLMPSELKQVNVSDSFRCLLLAILPVMDVSARTTMEGAAKCAKHCELLVSLLVSWCPHVLVSLSLVVSGMCGSLFGSQLLQSPLTAPSLMVLMYGGPLGERHCFSVFPEVSDGTICAFFLATRCSWCSAGVLEGSVTWSHLSVSPPFVALFVPCAAGMRCGHGWSLWPQGVRAALRVGRLTSNCSTERHSTVPHEANWLQWHLCVRATRASAKCLLRGRKLGSFFITLARLSRHA